MKIRSVWTQINLNQRETQNLTEIIVSKVSKLNKITILINEWKFSSNKDWIESQISKTIDLEMVIKLFICFLNKLKNDEFFNELLLFILNNLSFKIHLK